MVFGAIRRGLAKTRKALGDGIRTLLRRGPLSAETIEDIEEVLLAADFGPTATARLVAALEHDRRDGTLGGTDVAAVLGRLREHLRAMLRGGDTALRAADAPPTVILVAGVNGVGKTTSIAKLAWHLRHERDQRVVLAACDTFRAAAVAQLEVWARRVDVEIVRQPTGADAGAVAYDACDAALARQADVLIVDTAGRLHTRGPLMDELRKIHRILGKRVPGAPHEALLVLDATVGQNGLQQASVFREAIDVTGVFLAKLDGTAKGGVAVAIADALDIPIKFVGTGEGPEDLAPFDADQFIDGLLGLD